MLTTTMRNVLIVAAGCLVLTGCGPTQSSKSTAGANPTGAAASATTATTPPEGGGGGGGLTACALVTEQDASTALGSPAGAGKSGGSAALSECIYGDGSLIVGMKTDSKPLFDTSRTAALGRGATDLPGVGDSAFEGGRSDYATLEFLKGTTLVTILLSGDGALAKATALAKSAASKL